jgi:hypothetical protein
MTRLIITELTQSAFLPAAERYFISIGVRFFRAVRGKTAHRKSTGTMLPQAHQPSNAGHSVCPAMITQPASDLSFVGCFDRSLHNVSEAAHQQQSCRTTNTSRERVQ